MQLDVPDAADEPLIGVEDQLFEVVQLLAEDEFSAGTKPLAESRIDPAKDESVVHRHRRPTAAAHPYELDLYPS